MEIWMADGRYKDKLKGRKQLLAKLGEVVQSSSKMTAGGDRDKVGMKQSWSPELTVADRKSVV